MRTGVKLSGIAGGALVFIGAAAALLSGGADTVIVGGWITIVAAAIAIAGGVLADTRPGLATLLLALAVVAAGLVAPGVIPAIADSAAVFIGYLAGGALLLIGAILAFVGRNALPAGTLSELSH